MPTLMGGASGARMIIANYLSARVPAEFLPLMRDDLDVDDLELPDPETYQAYDPFELDLWPKIGSVVTVSDGFGLTDYTESDDSPQTELYTPTYNMIIFAWCRTPLLADDTWAEPSRQAAMILRDRMAAAVRMALLDDPSLDHQDDSVQLIIEQMREEYLEPIELGSGARWAAGVQWFVPLRVSEALALAPYGVANEFFLEVVLVGFDAPIEQE